MARYLKLQVPSSCKENWNNMHPDQSGRYCFSCQKSVVDFTQMTDNEVVNYFKSHQGSTCGRFTESQLNKDIPFPRKPLPWIKYFFQFSLPAFLFSVKSTGEASKLPIPMEIAPVIPKGAVAITVIDTLAASRYVYEEKVEDSVFLGTVVTDIVPEKTKTTEEKTKMEKQSPPISNSKLTASSNIIPYPNPVIADSSIHLPALQLSPADEAANIKLQPAPDEQREVDFVGMVVTEIVPEKAKKTEKITKLEKQSTPISNYNLTTSSNILVYPNPVIAGSSINVQCRSLEKGNYLAEWYTVSGQLVKASKISYDKKNTRISLPIDEMLSGTYFLKLTHEDGKHYSQQVVVRK